MKTNYSTLFTIILLTICVVPAKAQLTLEQINPQLRVKELKKENGDSEIHVLNDKGLVTSKFTIDLANHHYPATDKDDPLLKRWETWKYGAFLCYNSNQFSGKEFCRIQNPKLYVPSDLDVNQWISTLKDAGMKYAVLTARHTSGFLLWDSQTSEHDVANSSDTTDVVREYVNECQKQDIIPGLYYCLWGGKECPVSGSKEISSARPLIMAQLHELATNYGPIPYFWIDMKCWGPQDLSAQEIYDMLKNINPETVVTLNQHFNDGTKISYFPTDIMNGEMVVPAQSGYKPFHEVDRKSYYLPFEFELCSQKQTWTEWKYYPAYDEYSWFTYGEGKDFAASRAFLI